MLAQLRAGPHGCRNQQIVQDAPHRRVHRTPVPVRRAPPLPCVTPTVIGGAPVAARRSSSPRAFQIERARRVERPVRQRIARERAAVAQQRAMTATRQQHRGGEPPAQRAPTTMASCIVASPGSIRRPLSERHTRRGLHEGACPAPSRPRRIDPAARRWHRDGGCRRPSPPRSPRTS